MSSHGQIAPQIAAEDLSHVLTHTAELWEELRGQDIFITGGTGFFGCWLLESFAYANEQLGLNARALVLTRDPQAFAAKAPPLANRSDIRFLPGDIRQFQFPAGEFPFVIHAGTTSSAPVEPLEMFETIVDGTRRVLDFAAAHATRKLLFVSSGAVYGRQPPELTHISEDYHGAPRADEPNAAYGEGKRAAELLCTLASQRHGFETKIARCFAFVGPHLPLDANFAIGNFLRDALRSRPIQVNGDGTAHRSYLYAADLAIWLWHILFRGQNLRPYNVGSAENISIADLAELVKGTMGVCEPVQIRERPSQSLPASRYVPNVDRAQSELGVRPLISLRESLLRTAQSIQPSF